MLRDVCIYLCGPPLTGLQSFYHVERMIEKYREIITASVIWMGISLLLFEETQALLLLLSGAMCAGVCILSQGIINDIRDEMPNVRHPDLLLMRYWKGRWFMLATLGVNIPLIFASWWHEMENISWWNYVRIVVYLVSVRVILH